MRSIAAATALIILLAGSFSCGSPTSPSTMCNNGPYTFDSNPNVNRCRAANGQFAANTCCGR